MTGIFLRRCKDSVGGPGIVFGVKTAFSPLPLRSPFTTFVQNSNGSGMKIAIYGANIKKDNECWLEDVLEALSMHGAELYFHEDTLEYMRSLEVKVPRGAGVYGEGLPSDTDYMVTLGGDGTILRAAQLAYRADVPIVGINLGTLGFMATVSKERAREAMEVLFSGRMDFERKVLLQVESPALPEPKVAINEVVVSRKDSSSMIGIQTHVNGRLLGTYRADGLIVATPTGSTGYSLSCGGPIVSTDSATLVLTPVAPHNLNVRPMVFRDDVKVFLKVSGREDQYLLSVDSRFQPMRWEDVISVRKSERTLRIAKLPHSDFFLTLKEKLGWGNDGRQ